MSTTTAPEFDGVLRAINREPPADVDVTDDVEGEQETLADTGGLPMAQLQISLNDASKGVSESTHKEYKRFFPP